MMEQLMEQYLAGNRRALAKLITRIENNAEDSTAILDKIYHKVGRAIRIGITGPPGAGKSTLADQITKRFRKEQQTVAVIAVDPSSPFTGGALLGDRIRMNDLATDAGVFIRSMATRGSLGGLAQRAQEVADLFDAFGFDIVIYETVGVGQSELDIVQAADTTVVVLMPGTGDSIQAMKAGLMEIADIFVLNKADRQGAERMLLELKSVLDFQDKGKDWLPPVVQTVAHQGQGIAELCEQLSRHFEYLQQTDILKNKKRMRIESYIRQMVQERLLQHFWQPEMKQKLEKFVEKIEKKKRSPYAAGKILIQEFLDNIEK